MRHALFAAMLVLFAVPASGADRDPKLDAYFSCLVGKGVLEMHYGADTEGALVEALSGCHDERNLAIEAGEDADTILSLEDMAHHVFTALAVPQANV
jgi:hypothetical protein